MICGNSNCNSSASANRLNFAQGEDGVGGTSWTQSSGFALSHPIPNLGSWHHAVVTNESGNYIVYLDGQIVAQESVSTIFNRQSSYSALLGAIRALFMLEDIRIITRVN